MIRDLSPLRDSELFGGLTEEELGRLAPLASDFVAFEGSLIFNEGRRASHLYLVCQGQVSLLKYVRAAHARRGRRSTMALCGPGEVIGWSALVAPYTYTLSAVAWESSRLVHLEGKLLRQLLDAHPEMGYKVMKALASLVHKRFNQLAAALVAERSGSLSRRAV